MSKEGDHHMSYDPAAVFEIPKQTIQLKDFYQGDGWILDIGGGGEGIIGLIKGKQVVAIDRNRRELEGTGSDSLKIVMDATDLKFLDDAFEVVTVFFTFMYMDDETTTKTLSEIRRVLKSDGELLVWDPVLEPSEAPDKKLFLIWLDVELPDGRTVEAGYGYHIQALGPEKIIERAETVGLVPEVLAKEEHTFFMRLRKR